MGELERLLLAHIDQHGPLGFDEFQANALYAPDLGFYTGPLGRDFVTDLRELGGIMTEEDLASYKV